MKFRAAYVTTVLLLVCNLSWSQTDKEDYKKLSATMSEMNVTVDTTYIKKYKKINDYSTLGVQYGVALSTPSFQPARDAKMVFIPVNVGITYTKYCKMFGYMPYFALQLGVFYTQDAYEFNTSTSGYTDQIFGAYKATMQVLEVPALAMFHYDFWKMRILADVGIYGGWRMSIHREYKEGVTDKSLENKFADVENRFDYGIKAGGGFAFVLDPVEIHITASYKYSWSNLYQPNYMSKYYYRWAYPTNIILAVGVHYQLTRRVGTTSHDLKVQAMQEAQLMMKELKEKQLEQARLDSLSNAERTDSLSIRQFPDSLSVSPAPLKRDTTVLNSPKPLKVKEAPISFIFRTASVSESVGPLWSKGFCTVTRCSKDRYLKTVS